MKWVAKAFVQKLISLMPYKERLNYFFQKNVTGAVDLSDQYFEWKIGHAKDHWEFYNLEKKGQIPQRILELGTGWYPVVPIAFYLNGAESVVSMDIYDWMSADNIRTTIAKFAEWRERGLLSKHLPTIDEDRWQNIMGLKTGSDSREVLCNSISLEVIQADARSTPFEDESFDFITSNNTFEHIPKPILRDILKDFKRIVKGEGVMSHFVDLSDHFAHFDRSISDYNFLQFSDRAWNVIDNSIQPQNRLRWPDYLLMYKNLEIPVNEKKVRPGNLGVLKSVKVADQFKKYKPEDLAITHGYLISSLVQ